MKFAEARWNSKGWITNLAMEDSFSGCKQAE